MFSVFVLADFRTFHYQTEMVLSDAKNLIFNASHAIKYDTLLAVVLLQRIRI